MFLDGTVRLSAEIIERLRPQSRISEILEGKRAVSYEMEISLSRSQCLLSLIQLLQSY
jgi:plasmid maintenance system antidote protein VapI